MGRRDLKDMTVVIAGASSGIGRATALAFARRGAKLVLASRRGDLLLQLERQCRRAGGRALAYPCDVTNADEVSRLAAAAAKRFGRIDVWINNAGVGAVGLFTQTPVDAHDQVIRTNLMGTLHGAHAALRQFRSQPPLNGRRGVLINTISFGGWVPAPFAASYSASKFGMRGLSDALRAELVRTPDIHVCDVFPSFIDTPGVQHAANFTGRELAPAPPVYGAERVADAMVSLAIHPRDSVTVGSVATVARLGYAVAPALGRWIMNRFIEGYLTRADRTEVTLGNLYGPVQRGREASGGWRSHRVGSIAVAGLALAALLGTTAAVAQAAARNGDMRAP